MTTTESDIRVLESPRPRGRAVPALPSYTFQDTGITVQIRKMSPLTMQRIADTIIAEAKALPAGHEHKYPEPPVQMIAVGGGEPKAEPNPTDPDYQRALQRWGEWAGGEQTRRMLRIAAAEYIVWPDIDLVRFEAARIRRMFAREGATLPPIPDTYTSDEQDAIVFLEHGCFGSDQDLTEFAQYLMTRGQPQEAQIAAATAAFRAAEE